MKTYLVEVQYNNLCEGCCGEVIHHLSHIYGYDPAYNKAHNIFTCENVLSVQVTNADTGEIVILLARD